MFENKDYLEKWKNLEDLLPEDVLKEFLKEKRTDILENVLEQLEVIDTQTILANIDNDKPFSGVDVYEYSFDNQEQEDEIENIRLFNSQGHGWLKGDVTDAQGNEWGVRCECPSCGGILSSSNNTTTTTSNFNALTPQEATVGDYQIDGLLSGYKWTVGTNRVLTYSFFETGSTYYGGETGVAEVSEPIKTNFRNIVDWLENVINIDFVEVADSSSSYGQIRVMLSNNPSYAYAYYPGGTLGGDIHLNTGYDYSGETNGFQNPAGKHGYMSIIHELGHALGLKHSFETDTYAALPNEEDNTTNTVMTYNFTGSSAGTFMTYDIKTLQYLYGTKAHNTGDTTYKFTNSNEPTQFQVIENGIILETLLNTPNLTKQTIWDSAGIDTFDFSSLDFTSAGFRFDLTGGGFSTVKTAYNVTDALGNEANGTNGVSYNNDGITYYTSRYGTAIAFNVTIENLINSSSNDDIFANSVANTFGGYAFGVNKGSDIYWNTDSNDTLDLSQYQFSEINRVQNGNDLLLTFFNNTGSINVKNYYLNPLNIVYGNGLPTININDVTVNEEAGTATFNVSLSQASQNIVSVSYNTTNGTAIAGSDYTGINNGSLTFNAGETQKTIVINITPDTLNENNETFNLNLFNSINANIGDGLGIGTINDNDNPPSLSINNVTVDEASGTAIFTVNLSQASGKQISLNYSTSNDTAIAGSDYTAINNGSLIFNAGETEKTITVTINNDLNYEQSESFNLNLSNASNATILDGLGIATITDNDSQPTISINDVTVNENNGTATFTVSLSASSYQSISVDYATENDTAIAGNDYTLTSGTLTFNPGETSKTITVNLTNDTEIENNETFKINLSINAINSINATTIATIADSQGVATIVSEDIRTVNYDPASATRVRGTLTGDIVTGNHSITEETIALSGKSTTRGGEYIYQFTGVEGSNKKIYIDAFTSDSETFIVEYSTNQTTWTSTGITLNTTNNTSPVSFTLPSTVGTSFFVRIRDSIRTKDDATTSTLTIENIYASGDFNTPAPPTLPKVSVVANDSNATENSSDAGQFTFTRDNTSGALTVNYTIGGSATNSSDYNSLSGVVFFGNGIGSVTVDLTTINDSDNEGTETVVITLVDGVDYDLGTTSTATVNIADDDVPVATTFFATSEQVTQGTVSGSYLNTNTSDNVRETITEVSSGGSPSRRYSTLTHTWTFNNVTNANSFVVEALKTGTEDNFTFQYSVNGGTSWTDLVTVNSTTETIYNANLATAINGNVLVRVIDTNRTAGTNVMDSVSIDQMYFTNSPATNPASQAINENVDILTGTNNQDIFVLGDNANVYYGNDDDQDYALIDKFTKGEDIIQLHGSADDYTIGSSPLNNDNLGIYFQDDLIAIVTDVNNLSLDNNQVFAFV